MDRQLLDKLTKYLSSKTDPTEQEKELFTQLKGVMTDFDIAFINRATIERNGFVANNLSDEDMEDLASKVGDCVCNSQQFDYAIEQACRKMELEPILDCPLCGNSATYDSRIQTYTCNSCWQKWTNSYTLVEDLKETDRLPDDLGYPSGEARNSNARYIPEYDYIRIFKKDPEANSYFKPVCWPKSQKYIPGEDGNDSIAALNELINDEKGLEDFGANAVWVPFCNL